MTGINVHERPGNMKPHPSNACAGAFPNWLDVNLLPQCNAKCAWCIERGGWHPDGIASWTEMAHAIVATGKQHVLLLGGEPTLYEHLGDVIDRLRAHGIKVYLTTNGSKLTPDSVWRKLRHLTGINISLHSPWEPVNRLITHVRVDYQSIHSAVKCMRSNGTTVRFNCNAIQGVVETQRDMLDYVRWATLMCADSVRFCELQGTAKDFVSLNFYHIDPFSQGCCIHTTIADMPVEIRLACGLATPCRHAPDKPEMVRKQVLYYDGIVYDGWQYNQNPNMKLNELKKIMALVKSGQLSEDKAAKMIADQTKQVEPSEARGCGVSTRGC